MSPRRTRLASPHRRRARCAAPIQLEEGTTDQSTGRSTRASFDGSVGPAPTPDGETLPLVRCSQPIVGRRGFRRGLLRRRHPAARARLAVESCAGTPAEPQGRLRASAAALRQSRHGPFAPAAHRARRARARSSAEGGDVGWAVNFTARSSSGVTLIVLIAPARRADSYRTPRPPGGRAGEVCPPKEGSRRWRRRARPAAMLAARAAAARRACPAAAIRRRRDRARAADRRRSVVSRRGDAGRQDATGRRPPVHHARLAPA